MAQIFISYAHEDKPRAAALATAFADYGHEVWWDDRLEAGDRFKDEIEKKLSRVDAVVVLWTEVSVFKPWVAAEADFANERNKLVPVRYGKGVHPPGELAAVHCEYLGDWNGTARAEEIGRLNSHISRLKSASDLAKLAKLGGPKLQERMSQDSPFRTIFDAALPGGLRVYRFLIGLIATSVALWLALRWIDMLTNGEAEEALSLVDLAQILAVLATARLCDQLVVAAKKQTSDRFFDRSFSFYSILALQLGVLTALSNIFLGFDGNVNWVNEAVDRALLYLAIFCGLRVCILAFTILQRRVGS